MCPRPRIYYRVGSEYIIFAKNNIDDGNYETYGVETNFMITHGLIFNWYPNLSNDKETVFTVEQISSQILQYLDLKNRIDIPLNDKLRLSRLERKNRAEDLAKKWYTCLLSGNIDETIKYSQIPFCTHIDISAYEGNSSPSQSEIFDTVEKFKVHLQSFVKNLQSKTYPVEKQYEVTIDESKLLYPKGDNWYFEIRGTNGSAVLDIVLKLNDTDTLIEGRIVIDYRPPKD